MILEYAQLMATAHRTLDGDGEIRVWHNGKYRKWYMHSADYVDLSLDGKLLLLRERFPAATHINHPAAQWVRSGAINYLWLYDCWCCLLDNFKEDRGREHAWSKYREALFEPPFNCPAGWTEPEPIMPEEFKQGNCIESYQRYVSHKLTQSSFRNSTFQYYLPEWA